MAFKIHGRRCGYPENFVAEPRNYDIPLVMIAGL
jgi:hypothetical protein